MYLKCPGDGWGSGKERGFLSHHVFICIICSVHASHRSQLAPIIFHQIKSVVRVFVSISIFHDASRKENTYGKRSRNTRDNKDLIYL